ncbi:unnamed protein product [Vitrella brassicaformis CCMP3155]|uniref:Fe2OG dioxygenase domain-containing protein n=1 Tax=Vitrella brassicaformis (strain CCMP3155) TaxID=1169540 RepID=A0A0G4G6Q9_VITBC|nr:unnamed protein product [Vitrella brassicaformis CCMP3155]|eukprot:CEM24397.1 unnamed protein product [Vitrella brassicaformis CCMP3155]
MDRRRLPALSRPTWMTGAHHGDEPIPLAESPIQIAPLQALPSHAAKQEDGANRGSIVVRLKGTLVHRDPDMWAYPSFLSDCECEHLIRLSAGRFLTSLTSLGKEGAQQQSYESGRSVNRTSLSARLMSGETRTLSIIEEKVAKIACVPLAYVEQLVVVKYEPGEFFAMHHDGDFRPQTVLLYLNDVDEGGQTDFPDLPKPLAIKPQKGMALVWSNINPDGSADYRMMHQGLPPTSSVKYAVNCFINRDPIRLLASDEQRGPFCPFSSPKMQ